MRGSKTLAGLAVTGLTAALVVLPSVPALAHEERQIGPYTVAVGFGSEPAYVGYPNSIEVIAHQTSNGTAVMDAADTLKAEVVFGTQTMAVVLEPNFDTDLGGSPGDYRGYFIPTAPGEYTFHLTGSIGSTQLDERFTSSPSTFSSAEDPASIQFPTKVPSLTELSQKLDREIPRVQAAAGADAKAAKDAASTARLLAIIGLGVGMVGVAVASVALRRRKA